MKLILEPTKKVIELVINGVAVPARIWEGHTENGVRCHAYITRVAVASSENSSEFDQELEEQRAPTPAVQAIPLRMIL